MIGMPGQRLVDRVVDHLADHVVQAVDVGWPNIHTWAPAYRLQAFQNLNSAGGVVAVVNGFCDVNRHVCVLTRVSLSFVGCRLLVARVTTDNEPLTMDMSHY